MTARLALGIFTAWMALAAGLGVARADLAGHGGAIPDYPYSDALRRSGLVWSVDTVDDLFEVGPEAFIPGTKMPLQSMSSAEDRGLLIEFLMRITAPSMAN